MDITSLLQYTFGKVIETFAHNWWLLLISILISAALKLYVDQDAVARFLRRNTKNSVLVSTGIAVATPFCSCGTTAVVLGMMASTIPWAPIIAFMVASPLTSPQELFYSAGLFGWNFAIAFFAASILLGLAAGAIASFAEARGWLANQARMASAAQPASLSPAVVVGPAPVLLPVLAQPVAATAQCDCSATRVELPVIASTAAVTSKSMVTFSMFMDEVISISKHLLPLFFGFTFVGYLLNGLIPAAWITSLFGSGHAYSIPLAATLGLPFYINTEASLPLVSAMLDSGMSQGAALAFLITGAGTSLGALGGALTIARWRVVGIVVGILWAGSILIGFAYDLLI
ncbi:MAG: permease [Syntrophothermus sp.]